MLELRSRFLLFWQDLTQYEENSELTREQKRACYRIVLSCNSLAIVHLASGEPQEARRWSVEALFACEELGEQRGIGLASITLGRALQQMATLTSIYSHEECKKFLDEAIMHLVRALEIFGQPVLEPIRLIEAYKALGCVYRNGAALADWNLSEQCLIRQYQCRAVQNLTTAVELAESKNAVLYVDVCLELARIYSQSRQFDDAEDWLQYAVEAIPGVYKIEVGSALRDIPIEECVVRFWHQMGEIEELYQEIALDRGFDGSGEEISGKTLDQIAREHGALAEAYFLHHCKHTVEWDEEAFASWRQYL